MYYEAIEISNNEAITEILQKSILEAVTHLMLVVEYVNKRTGNFTNYNEIKETYL